MESLGLRKPLYTQPKINLQAGSHGTPKCLTATIVSDQALGFSGELRHRRSFP